MAQKPSIPKGTRDFSPMEMSRRNYIFDTIRSVFLKYGYSQIETPAMENLSTLLGKYGDEGDKLLFKILNSGDAFSKLSPEDLHGNSASLKVCEKGLRYDLTVPFARYVSQHQNEISFPFKRFQIQPVWRADRPQKGRYREFCQCDVDVIGSGSLLNELELLLMADEVFEKLGIRAAVKINNRKILSGLAEISGHPDKITDMTVAIDKIDKIGLAAVREELFSKGFDEVSVSRIEPVLTMSGDNEEKIAVLRNVLSASQIGNTGLDELEKLLSYVSSAKPAVRVDVDFSLARGLNYYTGAIFEVKALDFEIGSICGGGRYDDLAGIFGMSGVSGVGISFGADRIYDVLSGLDKFPPDIAASPLVMFANMGDNEVSYVLPVVSSLRKSGIKVELYPDKAKLKKQFEYASKKGIRYLAIAGENEISEGTASVKDIISGEQKNIKIDELLSFLIEKN